VIAICLFSTEYCFVVSTVNVTELISHTHTRFNDQYDRKTYQHSFFTGQMLFLLPNQIEPSILRTVYRFPTIWSKEDTSIDIVQSFCVLCAFCAYGILV